MTESSLDPALLYARQSKDIENTERAVTRQVEDGEQLAARYGVSIIERFVDNDRSAAGRSTKGRPAFDDLLKAIESGRARIIIAWNLDRLTRNRRDTVRLIETCQRASARILLVRGAELDMSTSSGRMVAGILADVAQAEIETKAERQQREALQAAQEGKWTGGGKPLGYEPDGVTVRSLLCPAGCSGGEGFTNNRECKSCGAAAVNAPGSEAAALEKAYRDVLEGVSIAAVVREWNAAGFRPKVADKWTRVTVRRVLRNPRNTGVRTYRGQVVSKAAWPGIVDESIWRAVDDLLSGRAAQKPLRSGTALLTGIAKCTCGASVVSGGNRMGERVIRCGAPGGKHFMRKQEPVEEYVEGVAIELLSKPDAADLLIDDDRPDVDELRIKAAAMRVRLEALAAEFADDDDADPKEFRTASRRLKERLAEVESQMADAARVDVLGPLINAEDVEAAWKGLDIDRKRKALDVMFDIVILPPGIGVRTFRPESVIVTPKKRR